MPEISGNYSLKADYETFNGQTVKGLKTHTENWIVKSGRRYWYRFLNDFKD